MRILIDLQGAQTGSRFRGIGRHATALTKAIIRNRGDHEVFILLNGLLGDTVEPIVNEFSPILASDRIIVFSIPSLTTGAIKSRMWRKEAAEIIREWQINTLKPDVVLITSLFEGQVYDNSIISIGRLPTTIKTAVVLHDLIPLIDPQVLRESEHEWYNSKIESLRRSDLLLAVSDYSRSEAITALGFDGNRVKCHYAGVDNFFSNATPSRDDVEFIENLGINRQFILYVSAFEPRKNFEGLMRAFALLPMRLRDRYQLVLITGRDHEPILRELADAIGIGLNELILPGNVSDRQLVTLYSRCFLFVCPAFREGFGLPALEAMACGAATIGSNATSIPEVIGRKDALFDPHSDRSIAVLMEQALTDTGFWCSLKDHAREWSKRFSWDRAAERSLRAMEELTAPWPAHEKSHDVSTLLDKIAAIRTEVAPGREDLVAIANDISKIEQAINRSCYGVDNAMRAIGGDLHAAENGKTRFDQTFVENLYRILYGREPDASGQKHYLDRLRSGLAPHELVAEFLHSDEFAMREVRRRNGAGDRNNGGGPPSDPVVEVICHRVWGREDRPRILLLKLDHIGDFVLTLDAFRLIRDTWPKAEITLICGAWNHSLARQLGWFDHIFTYNFYVAAAGDDDRDMATKIAEYRALDLGAFDLAVDLRWHSDNRMLLSHTDAKYRAGYRANDVALDLSLPAGSEGDMTAHIGGRTLALAAAVVWTFGTPAGGGREALLNERVPVRPFKDGIVVGISPGTRNALRSWGRERFAELARLLCKEGLRIVLIGGSADQPDTQFIAAPLPKSHVVDLAGTLPIADVPPVFAGLDLFIGGETGTTHMAAQMGVPTLCIHSGATNVESWRPVGPRVVTLRGNVSCSPCFLASVEECRWDKRCMDIPPSRVAAEAMEMVKRSGGQAPSHPAANSRPARSSRALAVMPGTERRA
ncbi:MAG TPA: glycosyltransferase [Stellaceae bacterium]|nr:glycosyltransferase [Stellaceae bacterium]